MTKPHPTSSPATNFSKDLQEFHSLTLKAAEQSDSRATAYAVSHFWDSIRLAHEVFTTTSESEHPIWRIQGQARSNPDESDISTRISCVMNRSLSLLMQSEIRVRNGEKLDRRVIAGAIALTQRIARHPQDLQSIEKNVIPTSSRVRSRESSETFA
jgi:hypothetical protein